jgi:hypothetical protein
MGDGSARPRGNRPAARDAGDARALLKIDWHRVVARHQQS